jgi:hypothetical protein
VDDLAATWFAAVGSTNTPYSNVAKNIVPTVLLTGIVTVCFGEDWSDFLVKNCKSLGSVDSGVKGRELRIDSIWLRHVFISS